MIREKMQKGLDIQALSKPNLALSAERKKLRPLKSPFDKLKGSGSYAMGELDRPRLQEGDGRNRSVRYRDGGH